ncbi:hypothetical protein CYLTODRAFT_383549 [Cylindrobasidium torrendii FP15055 ss-10]|uniref:VWFA domain-containing protein n=1 Tax=Cylindrobasidium torrendii FP15055 ss-10 TaxID=1314674 RepID=A0A0D7AWU4_9AGAR|nr:hypothetical protein CYLTODRAFT_383549 [Cylindrobasidium torrendii FP15055 ss-10]
MPLEATMMIIDNSEYMRNGDYPTTRFDAQSDAVNAVFQAKIDSNPENTVGIMTMAGKAPEVLVTHSKEFGQILQAVHDTSGKISGSVDITTAIAVAQLALKHRENKNLRQRIVVFTGSPLEGAGADEKSLVKLAKKLKKNNVALDVVAFGDAIEDSGEVVLRAFVDNTNSGDNSHLLTVPPGPRLISDAIMSSPILAADIRGGIPDELMGGDVASGSGGAGASNDFEFGVDPSLDPELAMALRMSMQEAQAREQVGKPEEEKVPADAGGEEDAMLKQAISMSKDEDVEMGAAGGSGDVPMDEDEDEEAAIARAIAMSMESPPEDGKDKK